MYKYDNRPEDLESKALWELYVLLSRLDKPYLKARRWRDDEEYLYHIESISRPEGKKRYSYFGCDDICDIRVPEGRDEWIKINLARMDCGMKIEYECEVRINTESAVDFSVFTLMILARISIPEMTEINAVKMKNGLPVTSEKYDRR